MTVAARPKASGPLLLVAGTALIAALLSWQNLEPLSSAMGQTGGGYDLSRMLLLHSALPRLATALIAGASLGLSGALFQQVLRNPLASPTTLGISAGANLALVIATLFAPGLLGLGRDLVALAGSAVAAGLVFLLGARRGFSPFSLVLSGLVVSLWCGALSAVLVMLNERYLVSLFIWGAGSLALQSWAIPLALLPKFAAIGVVAALIIRPLGLLELGESGAAALGVRIVPLRFVAVAAAVALAAFVTSAVGVIGFIGLVAPTMARLAGARRPGQLLVWSAAFGAALLWFADSGVQWLAGSMADFLPTGAITAIFGSPLLLLLLPRLKIRHRVMTAVPRAASLRLPAGRATLILGLLGLLCVAVLALFFGRSPDGTWAVLGSELWRDILPLRAPRVLGALAAGAMLATAGTVLQRLTGNEMASPEVLGISAGATLGVTVAIFMTSTLGLAGQLGFASIGAITVLAVILATASRSGLAPERVLLAGVALSAMVDAVVGVLSATGDPRAMFLLRWMSGSTYSLEMPTAATVAIVALLLCAVAVLFHRWLDLLPLGPSASRALGVPLGSSRLFLFGLAGLLSAAATLTVGPLSFIGLMAPHLARELGLTRARPQLVAAALLGGSLMIGADWLGRVIVFPYQLPAGIVSALIGAPFLMLLLRRKG